MLCKKGSRFYQYSERAAKVAGHTVAGKQQRISGRRSNSILRRSSQLQKRQLFTQIVTIAHDIGKGGVIEFSIKGLNAPPK